MNEDYSRETEFNRLVAESEALEARIEADLCIRPDTTGAMSCTQGYDHTGHCDWWTSPAVTAVLDRVRNAS